MQKSIISTLSLQTQIYEPLSTTTLRNTLEAPEEQNWPGMHDYFDNLLIEHENKILEEKNESESIHLSKRDLKTILISSTATLLAVILVIMGVIWACEQERMDRELLDYLFNE